MKWNTASTVIVVGAHTTLTALPLYVLRRGTSSRGAWRSITLQYYEHLLTVQQYYESVDVEGFNGHYAVMKRNDFTELPVYFLNYILPDYIEMLFAGRKLIPLYSIEHLLSDDLLNFIASNKIRNCNDLLLFLLDDPKPNYVLLAELLQALPLEIDWTSITATGFAYDFDLPYSFCMYALNATHYCQFGVERTFTNDFTRTIRHLQQALARCKTTTPYLTFLTNFVSKLYRCSFKDPRRTYEAFTNKVLESPDLIDYLRSAPLQKPSLPSETLPASLFELYDRALRFVDAAPLLFKNKWIPSHATRTYKNDFRSVDVTRDLMTYIVLLTTQYLYAKNPL